MRKLHSLIRRAPELAKNGFTTSENRTLGTMIRIYRIGKVDHPSRNVAVAQSDTRFLVIGLGMCRLDGMIRGILGYRAANVVVSWKKSADARTTDQRP